MQYSKAYIGREEHLPHEGESDQEQIGVDAQWIQKLVVQAYDGEGYILAVTAEHTSLCSKREKVMIEHWQKERQRLNDLVLAEENREIKRFFVLDHQVYLDGALPARTKELLGLVASLVLRCDDCVTYHLIRVHEEGVTHDEIVEALSVGLIVGGSIVIPHLRRAMERLHEIEGQKGD
jgi:AhpD family alkylhydroperoxidase